MTALEALLLGVIQGLTEFLPISSSGHLVIFQQLFGLKTASQLLLGFDLALHFGTLLAVIVVFYRDIGEMIAGCLRFLGRRVVRGSVIRAAPTSHENTSEGTGPAQLKADEGAYLAFLVIIGTVPAAVIGIAFADFFRSLFDSALKAGSMLLITGAILWGTRYVKQSHRQLKDLGLKDALIVGLAQAFAILPGISRSGTTIATALFSRWDRSLAARYSFLLAVPAILGGIVFEIEGLHHWSIQAIGPLIVGILAAAISGFIAIHWLLRVVQRGNLSYFSYYCWAVGIATLIWFVLFR